MKKKYVQTLPENVQPLPGFPFHFITPEGLIFSTVQARICQRQFGRNSAGYATCAMRDEAGVMRQPLVHRLVARVFVPGGDTALEVNHKDLNKRNNRAENLEWITHRENLAHARRLKPWKSGGALCVSVVATNPDTGEQHAFPSIKEAALWCGRATMAGNICKAIQWGTLAYGFKWSRA